MRGMFTAGVIDVMMETGIEFDGAIGVSAGAAFGCNYKSKQIGRAVRYNAKYCADKRYSGLGVLLREGSLLSKSFCYEELPTKLDPFDFETYKNNPMEFYLVCIDVETQASRSTTNTRAGRITALSGSERRPLCRWRFRS